jgi:hypothetical protein
LRATLRVRIQAQTVYTAVGMPLPLRQDLRNAQFVFIGRVVQRGAATMREVSVSTTTAVVTIEEVYRAPPVLQSLVGKSVTVVTKSGISPLPGQFVVFLANGWLYGESIAVIELAHESLDFDRARLSEHLMKEDALSADDALRERLRLADLVVSGKVAATRRVQTLNMASASEHAPLWSEATIDPVSFEKGIAPVAEMRVLYAASQDIRWYRSPKPAVGEQGIWVLHRQYVEDLKQEAFTALDPLDFHPIAALARVRALVRELSAPR